MSDTDGIARSEDSEYAGIVEASSVCGDVHGLEPLTKSISAWIYHITRHAVHPCTVERRGRTSGIGDGEGVLGERVQDSTRIVEELKGFATSVDDGCGDLQILHSIDVEVGDRGFDGQAGGSGDGGCSGECDDIGNKGGEGSTEGREEHHGEGIEGR